MSNQLDHEMSIYLQEMDKLKSKIMELQETKQKNEIEQAEKMANLEPNMKVINDWLISYKEMKGFEYKLSQGVNSMYSRDEQNKITEIYNNKKRNMQLFHIEKYREPSRPSEFMFNYIEAIYNILHIQQKRIDELEDKLKD